MKETDPLIPPPVIARRAPEESLKGSCAIEGSKRKLLDFWQWAYSDILNDAVRGVLAEYIVAVALDADKAPRQTWDSFDLLYNDIKIKVKSSSYVQSWGQRADSKLSFGIQPTLFWNDGTGFDAEKKRQADLYVFCVFACKDRSCIDPLDLEQWEFYVLPSSVLNEKIPTQKTLSLPSLLSLGANKCTYLELREVVESIGD